jgi:hypothetical protein
MDSSRVLPLLGVLLTVLPVLKTNASQPLSIPVETKTNFGIPIRQRCQIQTKPRIPISSL